MVPVNVDMAMIRGQTKHRNTVPPSNMTRHHIIPRNKLSNLWNVVKQRNHLNFLFGGVNALVSNAIKRDRRRNANSVDLQVNGARITPAVATAYIGYMDNNQLPMPASQMAGASVIEKIFQWWPANIHYGPSERLQPGNSGYDIKRDDGGNNFEESAEKTVSPKTFNTLKNLNNKIDTYISNSNNRELGKISNLISVLSTIDNVTPYDENQWTQERVNNKWYWRFK